MTKVVVYSSANCPYCTRAKKLLDEKGVKYEEIRIDQDDEKRVEMMERSGRRTVPQIMINDQAIGGFDDLWRLETEGKLNKLLTQ